VAAPDNASNNKTKTERAMTLSPEVCPNFPP